MLQTYLIFGFFAWWLVGLVIRSCYIWRGVVSRGIGCCCGVCCSSRRGCCSCSCVCCGCSCIRSGCCGVVCSILWIVWCIWYRWWRIFLRWLIRKSWLDWNFWIRRNITRRLPFCLNWRGQFEGIVWYNGCCLVHW